jgi:hypothetical protein
MASLAYLYASVPLLPKLALTAPLGCHPTVPEIRANGSGTDREASCLCTVTELRQQHTGDLGTAPAPTSSTLVTEQYWTSWDTLKAVGVKVTRVGGSRRGMTSCWGLQVGAMMGQCLPLAMSCACQHCRPLPGPGGLVLPQITSFLETAKLLYSWATGRYSRKGKLPLTGTCTRYVYSNSCGASRLGCHGNRITDEDMRHREGQEADQGHTQDKNQVCLTRKRTLMQDVIFCKLVKFVSPPPSGFLFLHRTVAVVLNQQTDLASQARQAGDGSF